MEWIPCNNVMHKVESSALPVAFVHAWSIQSLLQNCSK